MNEKELKKRRKELKRKVLTMEWDKKKNQIHFARNKKLQQYKKEIEDINQKLEAEQ